MTSGIALSHLVRDLEVERSFGAADVSIGGIAFDSRQVQAGTLFVALVGGAVDGHRFIPDALARGAAAVIGTQALAEPSFPYVQVRDSRKALAQVSAAFYGYPARRMTVLGVTGTDGKTSTINLIYHILQAAGIKAGMISTVNAVIGAETLDTGFHVTTPEAPDVQRYLARMVEKGLTHALLETTSHGLAQLRVGACDFDIGVVTNITHEHLDYHGTYEDYRASKGRLFRWLSETPPKPFISERGAVLNRDDSSYAYLDAVTQVRKVTYGLGAEADVQAVDVRYRPDGMQFTARLRGEVNDEIPILTSLVGDFFVMNCLAAIGAAAMLLHIDGPAVREGIASLKGIPGRMERIDLGQPFTAVVDFAHTPNALRCALAAARKLTEGRVIAVFGSAGLRDREKRRLMAECAAEYADLTVLTAEDPRTESLPAILAEMAAGMERRNVEEGKAFWRIADRREAIRFAVKIAQPGDLVIVCGKGHEQSMCFGDIEYPWDDRTALQAALAELLDVAGPDMPFLPVQQISGMRI